MTLNRDNVGRFKWLIGLFDKVGIDYVINSGLRASDEISVYVESKRTLHSMAEMVSYLQGWADARGIDFETRQVVQ